MVNSRSKKPKKPQMLIKWTEEPKKILKKPGDVKKSVKKVRFNKSGNKVLETYSRFEYDRAPERN